MPTYLKKDHVYLRWEPSLLIRVSYLPSDLDSFGVYAIEAITSVVDPLDRYLAANYRLITEEDFNEARIMVEYRINSFFKNPVLVEL